MGTTVGVPLSAEDLGRATVITAPLEPHALAGGAGWYSTNALAALPQAVDLLLIDSYLASAERLGMVLVYTVWHHDLLRGPEHQWGRGNWDLNGFRKVTPNAADFFADAESWRWQENLYRYIIARWGYSPAIMWMTVSELNGTSVGSQPVTP